MVALGREMPYPMVADPEKIPLHKRLLARIGIPTVAFHDAEHFKAPTPIYVAYCEKHGIYYYDYPHGYRGELYCPMCLALWKRLVELEAKAKG
ncbi:MAG: hypothetical protein DRJ67_01455 [Thermoprotei archaeon]|nr:MAG: hypothetical protein DRJ67_01455 [Thermoprotei archaeon]